MIYQSFLIKTILAIGVIAASGQDIVSTFDTDDEGWTVFNICANTGAPPASGVGIEAPSYSPAGGNSGGYIRARDGGSGDCSGQGNPYYYFLAPTNFLGDRGIYYGGSLSFQIRRSGGGDFSGSRLPYIFIEGAGHRLVIKTGLVGSNDLWASYTVPLRASAKWHYDNVSGPSPTEGEFQAVLGNLTNIRLRGEFAFGNDTNSLDNVVMSTRPATQPYLIIEKSRQIWWASKIGEDYQVQYQSASATNEWSNLGGIIAGNGTNNCVFDGDTDTNRFYQVLVLP